jgi:hypothetical protein
MSAGPERVISTLGRTAPVASFAVPTMEPVAVSTICVAWQRDAGRNATRSRAASRGRRIIALISSETG